MKIAEWFGVPVSKPTLVNFSELPVKPDHGREDFFKQLAQQMQVDEQIRAGNAQGREAFHREKHEARTAMRARRSLMPVR